MLTLKKRLGIYSNSTKSCVVDLKSGVGYSYNTFIAKKLFESKIYVVSEFYYSNTTRKHLNDIKGVLSENGIKFITVKSKIRYISTTLDLIEQLNQECKNLKIELDNRKRKNTKVFKSLELEYSNTLKKIECLKLLSEVKWCYV